MPTVTVNTDGGGDYSSLAAAIAGEAGDLSVIGKLTINCSGTTLDTSAVNITGYTNSDATNYIEIIGDGVYSLGVSLAANGVAITFQEAYTVVRYISIENTSNSDPGGQTHVVRALAGGTNCRLERCVVKGADPSFGSTQIGVRASNYNFIVENCVIYGFESSSTSYGILLGASDKAINCTVIGDNLSTSSRGIEGGICINCYSGNTFYPYRSNVSLTNCASSDASGSSGLQNIAINTTNFIAPSSDNYKILASSALVGSGVGPSSNSDVPTVDYDGSARSGSTTDIGYDLLVDDVAPTFTSGPSASGVTSTSMNVVSTSDESGTGAVLVLAQGASEPSSASFDAVEQSITAGVQYVKSVSGLTGSTTYTVWVRIKDSAGNSTAQSFDQQTSAAGPSITAVNASGYARSGENFAISGSNFGAVQGSGSVTFGGISCTIVIWADDAIVATAPSSGLMHADAQEVVVTDDGGLSGIESGVSFLPATGYSYAVAPASFSSGTVWASIPGVAEGDEIVYESTATRQSGLETVPISIDSSGVVTATGVVVSGTYEADYLVIDRTDAQSSGNGVSTLSLVATTDVDATPDQFSLGADISDATISTAYTRSIVVSGATAATDMVISVINAEYSIDGGSYTSAAGVVQNGQSVSVRVTSSASYSTSVAATLSISGVSDSINVITEAVSPSFSGTIPAQSNYDGDAVSLNVSGYFSDQTVYTYSATNLPTGLSIDEQSGVISGSVSVVTSSQVTINLGVAQSNTFTWDVLDIESGLTWDVQNTQTTTWTIQT